MHHHLDAYAYTNRLKWLPPQQKLIFALVLLGIALVSQPLTQSIIFVWMSGWIVGYARIPGRVYGSVLSVMLVFLVMSLPALLFEVVSVEQLLDVQGRSLYGILLFKTWYLFLSKASLGQVTAVVMRSLASTACLLFILFTIPFTELLRILRQCRIPAVLLDLLLLMYRFIFLFLDVLTQVQLAQQARGGYRTRQRWMVSAGLLAGQLVVRSLQRYQQFSLGLAARGFNGEFQVYASQTYCFSQRYALESLMGCIGLIWVDVLRTVFLKPLILRARRARKIKGFRKTVRSVANGTSG